MAISKAWKIATHEITFWSDNMKVLWQIHHLTRTFKPFVVNSLTKVLKRHVITDENSADRLTRGLPVEKLASKGTWWEGTMYLERKNLNGQWSES